MTVGYLEVAADGVYLAVRVTPKSRRPGIGGIGDGANLAVAVNAAPEDGKANEATIAALAEFFGVPKRQIALVKGAASRLKRFKIAGAPEALRKSIEEKLA
jgi:uncharacterized protein (TIGR00251 family)